MSSERRIAAAADVIAALATDLAACGEHSGGGSSDGNHEIALIATKDNLKGPKVEKYLYTGGRTQ